MPTLGRSLVVGRLTTYKEKCTQCVWVHISLYGSSRPAGAKCRLHGKVYPRWVHFSSFLITFLCRRLEPTAEAAVRGWVTLRQLDVGSTDGSAVGSTVGRTVGSTLG